MTVRRSVGLPLRVGNPRRSDPPRARPCYTGRMEMDVYDRYEQEADHYLAIHGLRVAADMLPTVREILVRETQHEGATYAGTGTVPGNTYLMRICAAQLWHAG